MSDDTRPVRASENLDWTRLESFLGRGRFAVEQFPAGHSNLTYLLCFDSGEELVLRRPPFGPVPPRAHDMAREYRVLDAVHPRFPLAPKPLLLCEDTSVIGAVFYLMERRRGIVIRDQEPPNVDRRRISESMVDTLRELHAIEGLDALGKAAGFVARQVRGWTERWHGSKTSEVPEMESLAAWLEQRIPLDPARPAIVHGDFKLDNVMLDAAGNVTAVFDWEMSAIGDPLIDVGILLCYWLYTGGVTTRPGWFTREEILDRYGAGDVSFYEIFAIFKLAVIIQQIYARYVRGQTDDPRFATLGERVTQLARLAAKLASRNDALY